MVVSESGIKIQRAFRQVSCLVVLLASLPANAIVSSTASSNWLGTGVSALDGEAKLILTEPGVGSFGCTGSLLSGGQYILTAAHCVTGDSGTATTSNISVSFANSSVTATTSTYYVDPSWNGNVSTGHDLALIKLNNAISSIAGYAMDLSSSAAGDQVALAGYGDYGTGTSGANTNNFGTLHYGYNQYDASSSVYTALGVSTAVYLYDFDHSGITNWFGSTGLGNNEAMIAPGDSGGASLANVNGVLEIVGVHDFNMCVTYGCTPNSTYGTIGGDTSVYANAAWLDSILFAVPEPGTLLLGALGLLIGRVCSRIRSRS